eukprot:m.49852 g.49852  ORF g.49852 m.49852 type:complete len:487 (-) comp12857_c0_seq1:203-1663(-)
MASRNPFAAVMPHVEQRSLLQMLKYIAVFLLGVAAAQWVIGPVYLETYSRAASAHRGPRSLVDAELPAALKAIHLESLRYRGLYLEQLSQKLLADKEMEKMNHSLTMSNKRLRALVQGSETAIERAVLASLQAEDDATEMEKKLLAMQADLAKKTTYDVTPLFRGEWQRANDEAWQGLLQHHGCLSEFRDDVLCCDAGVWPNFQTPLQPLVFQSNFPFRMRSLQQLLARGGKLTFVGDSISQQVYQSLKARAMAEGYILIGAKNASEHATASFGIGLNSTEYKSGYERCFDVELFRVDRTADPLGVFDKAVPLDSLGRSSSSKHIVVANIGLHFANGRSNQTEEFTEQLTHMVERLEAFNQVTGNFGFLRDITPQHFTTESSDAQGEYASRNKTATACSPWSSGLIITFRNNLHNSLLMDMAQAHNLYVQETTPFLKERYDAHLETRDSTKGSVLDCTHWCAPVFDVMHDTFMYILQRRFGHDLRL